MSLAPNGKPKVTDCKVSQTGNSCNVHFGDCQLCAYGTVNELLNFGMPIFVRASIRRNRDCVHKAFFRIGLTGRQNLDEALMNISLCVRAAECPHRENQKDAWRLLIPSSLSPTLSLNIFFGDAQVRCFLILSRLGRLGVPPANSPPAAGIHLHGSMGPLGLLGPWDHYYKNRNTET